MGFFRMTGRPGVSRRSAVLAGVCAAGLVATLPGAARADSGQVVDMGQVLQANLPGFLSVDTSAMTTSNVVASEVGAPALADLPDTLYMGTSTLTNNTGSTVTLSTPPVTKTVTGTVSTTVTNGVKLGAKSKVNFTIPLVGWGIDGEISAEYNYSSAGTNSTAVTETYTAPSQNIAIPPHTTATVTVMLKEQIESGTVDLHAEFGGSLPISFNGKTVTSGTPYQIIQWMQSTGNTPYMPTGVSLNNANQTVQFDGTGTFSTELGTAFSATVSFQPAPSSTPGTARRATAQQAERSTAYTLPVTAMDVRLAPR